MSYTNLSIIHDENSEGSILSFHPVEAGDGEFDFIDIQEVIIFFLFQLKTKIRFKQIEYYNYFGC